MSRRALGDTIVDLVSAAGTPALTSEGSGLRVRDMTVDLPIEVAMRGRGDLEMLANPYRWRWTTAFDQEPGRLVFRCNLIPEPGVAP